MKRYSLFLPILIWAGSVTLLASVGIEEYIIQASDTPISLAVMIWIILRNDKKMKAKEDQIDRIIAQLKDSRKCKFKESE